ncbi:hypothetical protein RHEph03_gp028 [Rhizobium phage RHEph03]|uniref:Uncharacterized protein n=2 Tax=Cuernavacavirus RHEph02 TaxID=2733899 RepID=L7TKP3_9CAUD|nr:hypothetical protein HOS21_gp27 [Rhizobium phage RHEph02]AGC35594.1 hypothetical protein RHEph02_gp027 [Rhizobium phage RHEph02]AGC35655.1 hypothetical protein RHEph03_gp028 [Rhizobium phage RHEph03]
MTEQYSPLRTLWDPSQVYVGKPVSREDSIRAADDWCTFIEAFRSGSTIVDPISAKDVDIFVRERACLQMQVTKSYKLDAGYSQWYVFLSDYRLVQYDPTEDDPLYAAAKEAHEITTLYRSEQYGWNVIVVADDFWPAYISASRTLRELPEGFTEKHMRQNLFINQKNVIHRMLGNEPRPLMEP